MKDICFIGSIIWAVMFIFVLVANVDSEPLKKVLSRSLLWPIYLVVLCYQGFKEDMFQ